MAERIANLVKDCKNQEHIGQLAMVDFTLERREGQTREGQTREDGSKAYFMSFKVNNFAFINEIIKTF